MSIHTESSAAEQTGELDGLESAVAEIATVVDLTRQTKALDAERPDPLEGEAAYEELFDRLARALHRSDAHAVLVGERGVGQTTLLAELARRVAAGRLAAIQGKRILLADCRYTNPALSSRRLLAILQAADDPKVVLCVEGFASLVRSEQGRVNNAVLLGILPKVQVKLLGLLSPREYEELVADDADMRELLVKVEAPEPDVATAERIVGCYAAGLEEAYGVAVEPEAMAQAVRLADRYVLCERLPGKAVKILRQVCEDIAYERMQSKSRRTAATADDVVRAVARLSGVPEETLRGVAERTDYEASLGREIFGQEHAVGEVATELGLIKAGLTDPDKPASVMLLIGHTGTGKTEMAKALARFYSRSKRLRTYTLGNFVEPHSVAGIIGVPPGYVGHEQGGRIVADLAADPYCVFLLDEADKAHPDVLQPFLNLFDEGWICDQRGVKAYADKAIFILTTNVGQRMLGDMARQGKTPDEMAARMREALSQIRHGKSNRPVFPPEFLARIRRIIVFQPLDRDAMEGICRKLLREMQEMWRDKRQKTLSVPDSLVEHIAAESQRRNEKSQGREGGRIVRKLMAEWIEAPVQRACSASPEEYQACDAVVIEAILPSTEAADDTSSPQVSVRFRRAEADFASGEEGVGND